MAVPGLAKRAESVAGDLPPLPRFKKGPWTPAEDAMLLAYIRSYGEGNWNAVQKCVGLSRAGKSCRLRWTNHLRPNLKKGSLTLQEERMIIHLQAHLGNKWSLMAQTLRGRTDNEIKNFWNTRKKRLLRAGKPLYPSGILKTMQMNSSLHEDITNVGNDSFGCPPLQLELPNFNIDQFGDAFLESSDASIPMQQLPYLESCRNSTSYPFNLDINANIAISSYFKSMSLMEPPSYQIEVPISPMEPPSYQIEVPMSPMDPPSYQIEAPISPVEPPSYQIKVSMSPMEPPSYQIEAQMSPKDPPSYQSKVPINTLKSPISNCFWQHHLPCNEKSPKMPSYASTFGIPLQTIFPSNTFAAKEVSMLMPNSDNLLEAFLLQHIQDGGRDKIFSNGLETLERVVPSTKKYSHISSDPLSLLGGQALFLPNEVIKPNSYIDSVVLSTTTRLPSDCEMNHFKGFNGSFNNAWT